MRSVYFASFFVGENPEQCPELGDVLKVIDDWLFHGRALQRPQDLTLCSNNKIHVEGQHEITTRYLDEINDDLERSIVAVRFEHPDPERQNRNWQTSIVLSSWARPKKRSRISIDVAIGQSGQALAPLSITPTRPRLVPTIIKNFGAREAYPLKACHINIRQGEMTDFINLLRNKDRQLPVCFVSCLRETESPLIDPAELADFLAGLAYVCVAKSDSVSWEMRDFMDDRLTAYNGAIRLYWPEFSNTDYPPRHRRWLSDQIEAIDARPGGFRSYMLGLIAGISTTRHVDDTARWEDVEAAIAKHYRQELKEKGETGELIELTEVVIDDLEVRLKEKDMEVERLANQLETKTAEAEQWRIAYQESRKSGAAHAAKPIIEEQVPPATSEDAVSLAQKEYSGKITFLQNRVSNEARHFDDPESLYKALRWLATEYFAAKTGVKSCANLDLSCREFCGFSYSSGQSEITMGKYKKDYVVEWGDQKHLLREHIGVGKGRDPRHAIRIAFFFDESSKIVVVGYIGQHQRTDAS